LDYNRQVYGNEASYFTPAISTDLERLKKQAEMHRRPGKTLRIAESPLLILISKLDVFGFWAPNWGQVSRHFDEVVDIAEEKRNIPLERFNLKRLKYFKTDTEKLSFLRDKPEGKHYQAHHIPGPLIWVSEIAIATEEKYARSVMEKVDLLLSEQRVIF
jgi:hypothetical protein